jgi:hypothetical protein
MICAEGTRQPIRIESVSLPGGSTGLRVANFGTRPNPFLAKPAGQAFGENYGTVSQYGFAAKTVAICGPRNATGADGLPEPTSELAVTLLRDTAATGTTPGLTVSYLSNGARRSVTLHYGVKLCSPTATKTQKCGG